MYTKLSNVMQFGKERAYVVPKKSTLCGQQRLLSVDISFLCASGNDLRQK